MTEGTRAPDEIRERIADHLGYCLVDGELHDPQEFEEKFAGFRWSCPDCEASVGRVEYHRALDLKWVLGPKGRSSVVSSSSSSSEDTDPDTSFDEPGSDGAADEETELLENVQKVQESLTGDEDTTLEDEVESVSASSEDDP